MLTQLVVQNGRPEGLLDKPSEGFKKLGSYLVNKVRSMIKQEVVVDATCTKMVSV